MISSLLTLLGLASIVAGVVVTAFVRAKKLGEEWEYQGAVGDLRRVRLIMAGVLLSISTAPP